MEDKVLKLMHRFGAAITLVADEAEDEGDRAYFGSTNDLDLLKECRDLYMEYRLGIGD